MILSATVCAVTKGENMEALGVGLFLWGLAFVPIARILSRLGLSPWWVLLGLIPLFNLIGLWWLAYADWPVSVPARGGEKEWSEAEWELPGKLEHQRRP